MGYYNYSTEFLKKINKTKNMRLSIYIGEINAINYVYI